MKKILTLAVLSVVVLTACIPTPPVRQLLDLVIYRGPGTSPISAVPPNAERLSCAVVLSMTADKRTGSYHVLDLDWRKYLAVDPGAYARACSVPAYTSGKSVPVTKAGGWKNDPASLTQVILLMNTNPDPVKLQGWGWWSYDMTPDRFATAYLHAWAANTNLAVNPK